MNERIIENLEGRHASDAMELEKGGTRAVVLERRDDVLAYVNLVDGAVEPKEK